MAKAILWAYVIIGVVMLTIDLIFSHIYLIYANYIAALIFISVCFIAVCESIEKVGGKCR